MSEEVRPGVRGRQRSMQHAERVLQACELRRAGASYEEIGRALGIAKQNAHRMVTKALASALREQADQIRVIEEERLDKIQRAAWGAAMRGDHVAINTVLRVMERRAKMLGLDAPTQTTASTVSEVHVRFVDDYAAESNASATPDSE